VAAKAIAVGARSSRLAIRAFATGAHDRVRQINWNPVSQCYELVRGLSHVWEVYRLDGILDSGEAGL
jgi:hypothetical protein